MAKATKSPFGRGLSALLKDPDNDIKSAADKNADKVVEYRELELDAIDLNPFNQEPVSTKKPRELASIRGTGSHSTHYGT